LDNPEHLEEYLGYVNPLYPPGYDSFGEARVRWSFSRWDDHMAAVGVWDPDVVTDPDAVAELLGPTWERLLYWQASGRRPLDPGLGLTPFNFGDELELRMYHGNNHSKIHTRLEATVMNRVLGGGEDFNDNDPGNDWDPLHSDWVERHETSESQEQLRNRELLGDLRSKLTAYNGARNDIMPAWLWWRWQLPAGYVAGTLEANNFLAQSRRKIDLREQLGGPNLYPGEQTMVERLPATLVHVLSQTFPREDLGDLNGFAHFGDSYHGEFDTVSSDGVTVANPAFNKVRRLAAGYAANILAYRDADDTTYLNPVNAVAPVVPGDAVPLPQVDDIPADMLTQCIGLELQPFLVEAFLAHVFELETAQWNHEPSFGEPPVEAGDRVLCSGLPSSTIVVVQIANPYDRPVTLIEYDAAGNPVIDGGGLVSKFELSVFGQTLDLGHQQLQSPPPPLNTLGQNLYVLRPGEARTYFAMEDPGGSPFSRGDWIDLLKLDGDDPSDTDPMDLIDLNTWVDLVVDYPGILGLADAWSTDRTAYNNPTSENHAIELKRRVKRFPGDVQPPVSVVVDRIDVRPGPNEPTDAGYEGFGERVIAFESLYSDVDGLPMDDCNEPGPGPNYPATPAPYWSVRNFRAGETHIAQIASASRMWRPVVVSGNITDNERNPRFVFANRHVDARARWPYNTVTDPDPNQWFTGTGDDPYLPNFRLRQEDVPTLSTDFNFPMQMLQKDGDFEQIGELLDVWLQAHDLAFVQVRALAWEYDHTESTFSEFMRDDHKLNPNRGVNRLRKGTLMGVLEPAGALGQVYFDDPMHFVPTVPAGVRVFDAFVCDGKGHRLDFNLDGVVDNGDNAFWDTQSYMNANEFSGALTPGLININTASREVLRSLPHWFRVVHEDDSPDFNPYVHLPEAVIQYRDRLGMPFDDDDVLPAYGDRGRLIRDPGGLTVAPGFRIGLRSERGFASPGELLLLERAGKRGKYTLGAPGSYEIKYDPSVLPSDVRDNILYNSSFRTDYPTLSERSKFVADGAGLLPPDPYLFAYEDPPGSGQWVPNSARVSVDVIDGGVPNPGGAPNQRDIVAEDAEEANLLFAGASNMITTRSDVFTVYFRIRSFRQNPVTGAWDATDPEAIVEENRYVMLVDRSEVNRPSDRPKILYLEQLPP
ncbi:MAG: hypothetical protein ACYTEI_03985, partial [Planctomycetota bacterium]